MSDLGHQETDKRLDSLERRVAREYMQAYEETEAKLADYLDRFRTKDQIKSEAVKRGEITEEEYKRWRQGQICMGQRWQEMVDTLAADYSNANQIAASISNGEMADVYALNHDYATFEVERGSQMDTSYTLYDRATVERLIKDQPNLLPKSTVNVPKDVRWNRQKIASAVTRGILQGEALPKVAKRLRSVADMNHAAAIRNARTMVTSAQNAGRITAYSRAQSLGIGVRKEWVSTLDGRTRHSHRQVDGEKVGMEDKFSNGLRYPGDPDGPGYEVYNCRCTLVADVEGVDQSNAPRNSKLGSMSYEEWKQEKVYAPSAGSPILHASYADVRDAIASRYGEEGVNKFTQEFAHYQGDASTGYATGVDSIPYVTEVLDSLEEVKITSGNTLYRGIGLNELNIEKFLEENAVGNAVTMRSLSWTASEEVANKYANGVIPVVYENVTPGKKNAVSMMEWERHEAINKAPNPELGNKMGDFIASQEEVLQTRADLEYEVVEVVKHGNGYRIKVREKK
jgi:SPP1 gp7 family putative phage head morphogenesis protein